MRLPRVPVFIMLGAPALTALVAAASCTSFSGDDDPLGDASGAETGSSDAPLTDVDADSEDDGGNETGTAEAGTLRLPCPPPSGGTAASTTWATRKLYTPAARMYPFAIATDATHITWVAQPGVTDGGTDGPPYNGVADAVVLRVSKLGNTPAHVLARDQPTAIAIALDGDYVYWTTYASSVAKLMRQRRDADCDAGCAAPELAVTFPSGVRIHRLIRPAAGILFAMGGNGQVYRMEIGTNPVVAVTAATLPGIAATGTHVYAAALLSAKILRTTVAQPFLSDDPYMTIAPVDSGDPGYAPIATDCSSLWLMRGRVLARHGIDATPVAITDFTTLGAGVFDVVADAKYVYTATPNAGGIHSIDTVTRTISPLYPGNVFALAVDDDGVYFGEHAMGAANAGTMSMLVKK